MPCGTGSCFALSPEDYQTMALNIAEILRYVRESSDQLDYYRGELNDR